MKKALLLLVAAVCGIVSAAGLLGLAQAVARLSVVEAILAVAVAAFFGSAARVAWRKTRGGRPPRVSYKPGGTLFDD